MGRCRTTCHHLHHGLGQLGVLPACHQCDYGQEKGARYVLQYLTTIITMLTAAGATEKKDGKKSWDPAPHSQEMESLSKQFGRIHAVSSLLNLVTLIATITYGFNLSTRI